MTKEDVELSAIQNVIEALTPLDEKARTRVVMYVFQRLGLTAPQGSAVSPSSPQQQQILRGAGPLPPATPPSMPVDIRSLKEAKKPRSANEMATIVAYYLAELASREDRKEEITVADVNKYFKQGGFPLPKVPGQTLLNARNSGYLDSGSQQGSFKLNPVGYNLVAHGLPAVGEKAMSATSKSRKKTRTPKGKSSNPKSAKTATKKSK